MATYVITTLIGGRKKFITAFTLRYNYSLIPEFSEEGNSAKVFTSKKEAEDSIRNIHNTHDRTFIIEPHQKSKKNIIHPKNRLQ